MKQVCIICGARWVDGKGWTEKHAFPCANDRYGWAFTRTVPNSWRRGMDCAGSPFGDAVTLDRVEVVRRGKHVNLRRHSANG